MKQISVLLAFLFSGACLAPASTVLARWTFENSAVADVVDASALGPVAADEGQGQAYGYHAASTADWTTPAGNGSANALSSNAWRQGDYYEFRVATLDWEDIVVTWDQARTSTGPSAFDFEYSVDGVAYTVFTSGYVVPLNEVPYAWGTAVRHAVYGFRADLSGLAEVEHAAELRLRLRQTEAGLAATGASRVDNFLVTAIPEPSAALLGAAVGAVWLRRRRG